MEDADKKDGNTTEAKAFAITGFRTLRKPRQYRPSYRAKTGLEPIYEDVKSYEAGNLGTNTLKVSELNITETRGTTNQAFNRDYEEVNEIECRVNDLGKRRSHSMIMARRHSPATEMLNDLMKDRRRKTEPVNQSIQTADWKPPDLKSLQADGKYLKRAKSSIYHKGNLYMGCSSSTKGERRKRWTKLEAEPPTDDHLCCPAERKMERRVFVVLFVFIVALVCAVLVFMVHTWMIQKVGGEKLEMMSKNGTWV